MNTPQTPDYGEPWKMLSREVGDFTTHPTPHDVNNKQVCDPYRNGLVEDCQKRAERIIACVNAMAGRPDPAAAMARLRQIEEQINSFDGEPAKPDAPIPAEVDPFCCMKARCKDWEVFSFRLYVQSAKLQARLRRLDWTPVTERLPERDDADQFEDVEWSDGRDIWQGNYRNEDNATHWRRITLP